MGTSRRHLSVFIRSGIHTVFAINGKDTDSISVQSHLQVNRRCMPIKTQNSKIIWARCILLNLRSRTPQRTLLLLLIQIYFCQLGGMVNFSLPFTTNEMISISTSQISVFKYNVVIFHLHRSWRFYLSAYTIRTRACSSNECFILRAMRLSSKLRKQGYLAERLKSSFRKFYGLYGDHVQQRILNDILTLHQLL